MTGRDLKALQQRAITLAAVRMPREDQKTILDCFCRIIGMIFPDVDTTDPANIRPTINSIMDSYSLPEEVVSHMNEITRICDSLSGVVTLT